MRRKKIFVSFGDGAGPGGRNVLDDYMDNVKKATPVMEDPQKDIKVWTTTDLANRQGTEVKRCFTKSQSLAEPMFVRALTIEGGYVAHVGHASYGCGLAWDANRTNMGSFLSVTSKYNGLAGVCTGLSFRTFVHDGGDNYQRNFRYTGGAGGDVAPSGCVNCKTYFLEQERYENTKAIKLGDDDEVQVHAKEVFGTAKADDYAESHLSQYQEAHFYHYYTGKTDQTRKVILKLGPDRLPAQIKSQWVFIDTCKSGLYYADGFLGRMPVGSNFFYCRTGINPASRSMRMFVKNAIENEIEADGSQTHVSMLLEGKIVGPFENEEEDKGLNDLPTWEDTDGIEHRSIYDVRLKTEQD